MTINKTKAYGLCITEIIQKQINKNKTKKKPSLIAP